VSLHSEPGTCRNCGRRRDVFSAQRHGGGNYRRPGRLYSSSICMECAKGLIEYVSPDHSYVGGNRWSARSIERIVKEGHPG
jgi:hypothetical protein